MISEERLLLLLSLPSARGYDLNDRQKEVVGHADGPLWITAGPGSGKTEVLVTRVLTLLCCRGVHPRSLLVTTFTKKAARNLEDRLSTYLATLEAEEPVLGRIDAADLRIGTIHSLANDILQEYRFPGYQNVRLLDDVEQHLFVYRRAAIVQHEDLAFWRFFSHAVPSSRWNARSRFTPGRWPRAKAAVTLFNHLVEDLVDLDLMAAEGGHWSTLVEFYRQYVRALEDGYRCDFAHLQERFLRFLQEPVGRRFLDGIDAEHPALEHVLVDEYQDTNPIQERIYHALADREPHNLAVVGDDDQALYRFRGGTVACMVHFDEACRATWGVEPTLIQLQENYRSHAEVVNFVNDYITSFPEMQEPGVRAPGKQPLIPSSNIGGTYPAVTWLQRPKAGDIPGSVADLVHDHLLGERIIQDPSQCVLLMRSAKDSAQNAGPFIAALEARGIPVYNPRSKGFMDELEVVCLLGALVRTVDPALTYRNYVGPNGRSPEWTGTVQEWVDTIDAVIADPAYEAGGLSEYIRESNRRLRELVRRRGFLNVGLMEILYRILAHEPFQSWQRNPSRNLRLSKVTRLFESYQSMGLDALRADGMYVDPVFLNRFYYMFAAYLIESGVDDDEDEDVVVPRGFFPIMTVHQSKGLEFPFVIVGQLGTNYGPGPAQILDNDLAPFRRDLYPRPVRPADRLAREDDIRLFYVAYSRAQYGLILAGTRDQVRRHVAAPAADFDRFRRSIPIL